MSAIDVFERLQQELQRREKGRTPLVLSDLTPREREVLPLLLRYRHLSLAELSAMLDVERGAVQPVLDGLVAQGILLEFRRQGERRYRPLVAFGPLQETPLNIWAAVQESVE